jgi:hypothetical protein
MIKHVSNGNEEYDYDDLWRKAKSSESFVCDDLISALEQ